MRVDLENFIENNVESGSTIVTDGWTGYNRIGEPWNAVLQAYRAGGSV